MVILLTLGLLSNLPGMVLSPLLPLLLILGAFIGVAHYVHTKSLQPSSEREPDLGTEHPIRIHKLVPDERGPGFFDADG